MFSLHLLSVLSGWLHLREDGLAVVSRRLLLRSFNGDIKARSSATSTSSCFAIKSHRMPALLLAVFLMTQSNIKRNRNPDMMHPCLTPVLTSNHSDSSPLLSIDRSHFLYRVLIIRISFPGIPYAFIIFHKVSMCSESKAFMLTLI